MNGTLYPREYALFGKKNVQSLQKQSYEPALDKLVKRLNW
jgi:hypothetical protein